MNEDADWLPYEAKGNYDHSSLIYYPEYVSVMDFTYAVKQTRKQEKMSLMRTPQHLPKMPFQDFMWSWSQNRKMHEVKHPIESEMTFDWRDEATRMKAKYNDPDDSLNATVAVLKNAPQFIHRTTSKRPFPKMSLHHLVH